MDFFKIRQKIINKKELIVYPDFLNGAFKDLMVRGGAFYAIWDEDNHKWSRSELDVARLIDAELNEYYQDKVDGYFEGDIIVNYMNSNSTKSWEQYKKWIKNLPDNYHQLDDDLTFAGQETSRDDYRSKCLSYPLLDGDYDAYDELIGTLYDPEERRKIEWAIGSVVAGDSKHIQKFIVFYGSAGAGKSTILNIIQQLFQGYYATFEAKALASSNNSFSTEVFKDNPLVAIQHDGDLSKIEDNSKLNSIISHEEMWLNEKYKSGYTSKINAFLFMATNRPVKITDAKSGIIRRLIDVKPSGRKIPESRYFELMGKIPFELNGIAYHCLEVYRELGKEYYSSYHPINMMFKTDTFFNFVESEYFTFEKEDGIGLRQAYSMYKEYCEYSQIKNPLPMYLFREELKNYFRDFKEITRIDGKQMRSRYIGFLKEKFKGVFTPIEELVEVPGGMAKLELNCTESVFDKEMADCPAQYATEDGTPKKKWNNCKTKLKDIDTTKLHYVKVPENHIVIDFDLKDNEGNKSPLLNLTEARKWPATYAEFSKSGAGIHLHYIYDGDVSKLSRIYSYGIEIKVFSGNSSLRRKLSKCNDLPITHISSGLPLKEEKVINFTSVKSERSLRNLLERNLRKEIHPGTKPSIDFIYKILNDAYESGLKYDVSDMRGKILAFANNSSHQAEYCIKLVNEMKFQSESQSSAIEDYNDDRLVFFDVEVFPNLFLVNWKYQGAGTTCVRMINPKPSDIEDLMQMRLIGFNCRKYDNHILYARYLGYSNEELYKLSQKIVAGDKNAFFGEAYNISYTDVYDFASAGNKKSLKKFEIDLGIHHEELALPWDEPVPENRWPTVAKYCDNDVIATEKVFEHLSGDWAARQILAKLSGLSVNDTTNQHSARIIFGSNKHPQSEFVYTDLSTIFPGYKFERGKSSYRGEDPGEGGYVYAEPGMYSNVGLLDIASMHPSSIEALNLFGSYTKVFSDIKNARVAIKHQNYDDAEHILDGKLAPFVEELKNGTASYSYKDLANALKTVINSVYGLTSARFANPFKDPRNIDNIVAKRGALFMIDLKHACQERGWTVVHIKTDSIKLANVTDEMIQFVTEFGKKYGYTFEHEATYSKMCIVNNSTYISKLSFGDDGMRQSKNPDCKWSATGAQFAQPYVFKTLFSHESIRFEDTCETKSVKTRMYLDMNEGLTVQTDVEKELTERNKTKNDFVNPIFENVSDEELRKTAAQGHEYIFIGRVGQFTPMKPGSGGGLLVREKDGKYYAVTGTKGYRWLESESVKLLKKEKEVDLRYYNNLVNEAVADISKFGDFEWFVSDDDELPWDPDQDTVAQK